MFTPRSASARQTSPSALGRSSINTVNSLVTAMAGTSFPFRPLPPLYGLGGDEGNFFSMHSTKGLLTCPVPSICGAVIYRVCDSRNACARRKAIEEHDVFPPCCAPASIVHLRRIIPRHGPAYLKLSRAARRLHTPLPDSGGTGSLSVLVVPQFRKAPRLDATSVAHARSPIQETNCNRHYVCRSRMRCAILTGPFGDIRS